MLSALVLRSPAACRLLSQWETSLLANQVSNLKIDRPVFIAGLARAGTTILLRKICELSGFAAHRYSDFPFIFTPYAWAMLRRWAPAQEQAPRERMHKDRIMVTAESPEAMEEVLWMAFFSHLHDPSRSNVLDSSVKRPDFETFFADHIRKLILARAGQRYVSKNNYNVTRLAYLRRMFPNSCFLIPIRSPVAHVASLMKQQDLFCRVQNESMAVRRHLRSVGHFEFGLDRRPINPADDAAVVSVEDCWRRGQEVRGWARYWAMIYRHVADRLDAEPALARRSLVVPYEDLCGRAAETMAAVSAHIGSPADQSQLATGLQAPEYYTVQFTAEERAIILEETSAVARRFGYSPEVAA